MTPEQIAALVQGIMNADSQPAPVQQSLVQPTIPPNPKEDYIQSSIQYSHEIAPQSVNAMTTGFTPVVEETVNIAAHPPSGHPVAEFSSSEPPLKLSSMEQDLAQVYAYCIQSKGQTQYTVESVMLQQCLRIIHRLEHKVDSLEELITDELIGASKDDDYLVATNSTLTFMDHPSAEEEKIDWIEDQTQNHSSVQNTGHSIPVDRQATQGKRQGPRKRRRGKRNRKNGR